MGTYLTSTLKRCVQPLAGLPFERSGDVVFGGLKSSLKALMLMLFAFQSVACQADSSSTDPAKRPVSLGIMAFQSDHSRPFLNYSELVLIPNQEVRLIPNPQPGASTLSGTWFEAFEPGVHSGQSPEGTAVVELAWREAWYQSYHVVFALDRTDMGHEVTHLGLLRNSDAEDEWMRIGSVRLSLYEDAQQLQIGFSLKGDWSYQEELLVFEGFVNVDPSELTQSWSSNIGANQGLIDYLLRTDSTVGGGQED